MELAALPSSPDAATSDNWALAAGGAGGVTCSDGSDEEQPETPIRNSSIAAEIPRRNISNLQ
jgi:hypothetical protein